MALEELREKLQFIEREVASAAARSGRERSAVRVVAVTKHQPISRIREYLQLMQSEGRIPCIGENYVQEFRNKQQELVRPYRSHCIGPLQSNKARDAVALFDVIETIDRAKIARLVAKEAESAGKQQDVFIQVNISDDSAKAGVAPGDTIAFVQEEILPRHILVLQGLMTIPRFSENPESVRGDFRALRELRDEASAKFGRPLELSMGMSTDFVQAIEEGATEVRIGTALFGERE